MSQQPPLRIWTDATASQSISEMLRTELNGHILMMAGPRKEGAASAGPDPALLEANVALGQPDPDQVLCAKDLRWVQLTSAGYTRYEDIEFGANLRERGVALTNSSSVTDEPCAQHLLAMMTALSRQLPQAARAQQGRKWADQELAKGTYLLTGQTALVLGFGAIARRLIELLAPLKMRIIAMRREIRGDEPVDIVTADDVDDVLGQVDHVINILPAGPTTGDFVDTARLQKMKRGAVFYNIGRGATVDHPALLEVLQSGQLRAAYLDVTSPEPLPPDSPLWNAPNCFITPHIAASHDRIGEALVRHFTENLRRFLAGEQLKDRVI